MNSDKQNEQMVLALDLARIGFYDWDVQKDSITFSKNMLNDWGIESPESTSLQDAIDKIHPADQERVKRLVNEAMHERKPYSTEYRVVRPDGKTVWVEVHGIVHYDDQGTPIRFFGTSLNITDRKMKEAELEENEKMIRTFLDTMPQMSFIADGDGNILHFNQRWYEYVRLEGAEGQGWKDRPIHHPEDLDRTIKTWNESLQTGKPYEIIYRLRRFDGEYRWHLGRAFPVKDYNGRIRRWYGTNTDIHEERVTLERNEILYKLGLKLSEGLSSKEVAQMILTEGIRILNGCGGIVLVKEGESFEIVESINISQIFLTDIKMRSLNSKMPAKAVLYNGEPVFLSTPEDIRKEFPDFVPVLRENDLKSLVALPLINKGQAVASVAFYMKDPTEFNESVRRFLSHLASLCGVAIDRAFLIEKQELQKAQLREAVSARDEFFSIASHELKTPLTSLRLNGQLLRRRLSKQPDKLTESSMSDFLNQNERNIDKLVRLVDDMLDISRVRTGKITIGPEACDLNEIATEVVERGRGSTAVDISFDPQGPINGEWDRLRIEQVFSNLLSNAIRYGEQKPIQVKIQAQSKEAVFSVRDQGTGIPKEVQRSIFERYERGHAKDIQGLGLGLYIARHIVEAHGGKIWVESQPGEGSEFFVSLPL